jgi:hypothetical protein
MFINPLKYFKVYFVPPLLWIGLIYDLTKFVFIFYVQTKFSIQIMLVSR